MSVEEDYGPSIFREASTGVPHIHHYYRFAETSQFVHLTERVCRIPFCQVPSCFCPSCIRMQDAFVAIIIQEQRERAK